MKKFLTILFLIFFSAGIYGQDTNIYVVSGKVLNGETLKPVPKAFLLNLSKYFGTQADTAGRFRILMTPQDTIRISSIGYEVLKWQPDFSKAAGKYIRTTIYMKPKTYEIGAVDIYKARWEAFVYDVQNTKINEKADDEKIKKWVDKLVKEENLASLNIPVGLQIALPIKTHREKQLAKIAKVEYNRNLNEIADKKFNKEFVSEITGLEGEELDKFMQYCSFDRDFIIRTPEYDLIVIVQDIYKEYTSEQNKKQK